MNTPAQQQRANDADRAQGAFSICDRPDPEMTRRDGDEGKGTLEWLAIQSVCTVSIFAALLGYDIGVMAGALLPMSRDLDFTSSQGEVAVGCLNFISAVGAIGGGVVYNRHGAVKCVKFAMVLYAIGMFVIALSGSFASVFFGRLVCGLGVGLGFAICPQYIAEISPPKWRGVLVSMFEISINIGLLTGYIANLAMERVEDSPRWRGLMILPTIPTVLTYAFLVPKLPESPRWLLRDGSPGKEALAREVLVKTCGAEAASPALADIKQVLAAQQEQHRVSISAGGEGAGAYVGKKNTGWRALFFEPAPRRALLIGAGTAFFQQANGSEAAVYYVPQVLRAAGVKGVLNMSSAPIVPIGGGTAAAVMRLCRPDGSAEEGAVGHCSSHDDCGPGTYCDEDAVVNGTNLHTQTSLCGNQISTSARWRGVSTPSTRPCLRDRSARWRGGSRRSVVT